ncbi:glycine cleavage system transcriptional repressor [Vibrio sp. SS-MA-C1-2]|uniref:glycine cleavage system protein R n=1 Tax=Vibrio sp. SS-MA-C1-2 TaxID=2908646 RepID=UPI001F42F8FA|nr:ACT domain-containing protein [Vibrio sp. SS-MA-C1-2]UJF19786.1 glycine cleavage system transcriptional repressor [Vibrio sp. SS-MA-C1-2]
MEHYLVITAVGTNRQGISNQITHHISECNCNIVDSRIANFGAEFTLIMLLSGNNNSLSRVEATLPLVGQQHDLLIVMKRTSKHTAIDSSHRAVIKAQLDDTPGIIQQYTEFLASRTIDISTLKTDTEQSNQEHSAPQLHIEITTRLPDSIDLDKLEQDFMALGEKLNATSSINFMPR